MAYDTWDWDEAGKPDQIYAPKYQSPLSKSKMEAGYQKTRAKFVFDWWIFQIGYGAIKPSEFIWMVEFFNDHRGGQLFYFQWPFELYGLPDKYGGEANPGTGEPFDTDVDIGYGDGPIHTVRFGNDEFPFERHKGRENYWFTSSPLIFEQVQS